MLSPRVVYSVLSLQTNKEYKKYRIVILSLPHEEGQVVAKHMLLNGWMFYKKGLAQ